MLGNIMIYIKVVTNASGKINLNNLMLWIFYILHRLIWKINLSSFMNFLYNQKYCFVPRKICCEPRQHDLNSQDCIYIIAVETIPKNYFYNSGSYIQDI